MVMVNLFAGFRINCVHHKMSLGERDCFIKVSSQTLYKIFNE